VFVVELCRVRLTALTLAVQAVKAAVLEAGGLIEADGLIKVGGLIEAVGLIKVGGLIG
jgi:hypothetical protein